jgi:hypothetical protein
MLRSMNGEGTHGPCCGQAGIAGGMCCGGCSTYCGGVDCYYEGLSHCLGRRVWQQRYGGGRDAMWSATMVVSWTTLSRLGIIVSLFYSSSLAAGARTP